MGGGAPLAGPARRLRAVAARVPAARPRRSASVQEASQRYLFYVLLPAWFVPGLLDWWMHRRTRIEETTGLPESLLHSLMMAEAGAAVLAGLVLDVNAAALSLMTGGVLAHQATAMWDVMSTYGRREIRPVEQHVHSALEMIPFMGLSFAVVLHPDQVATMLRHPRDADWRLRSKRRRPGSRYLVGVAAAVAGLVVLPYGNELYRCLRAGGKRRRDRDESHEETATSVTPAPDGQQRIELSR